MLGFKSRNTFIVVSLISAVINLTSQPASAANQIRFSNLTINLPDSVKILGNEIGSSPRSCAINVSVDADPGTVIPLRTFVVINLVDSLNTTVDNAAMQATTEGLTHLEFRGVFHCGAAVGTLKPPYKFTGVVQGIPNTWPFLEAPVTVIFEEPAANPTPNQSTISQSGQPQSVDTDFLQAKAGALSRLSAFSDWVSGIKSVYPMHSDEINSYASKALSFPVPTDLGTATTLMNLITESQSQIEASVTSWSKVTKSKVSIICTKGKLIKQVTGINPKCPAGYKLKR